jgi:hypothetical protein
VEPGPGRITIKIPADFSALRAPEQVVAAVQRVCNAVRDKSVTELFFDHSQLVSYDLPAEAVLDVITREVRNHFLRCGRKIRIGGVYPLDGVLQRFLRGIGMSRHLDDRNSALSEAEQGKLKTFQQHKRTPTPKHAPAHTDEKSSAAQDFANFIDDCLGSGGRRLTPLGRKRICDYTGEIIDNIEQHADTNYWYIAGYLDTSIHPPVCEIAIFNFGRSFAGTFMELEPGAYALSQVAPYIDKHRGNSWFGDGWHEDDLYTLAALQTGISSKSTSLEQSRGQGTTDLIRFFEHLYSEGGSAGLAPEMILWSGYTHIYFNGRYRLTREKEGRWTIAFNDENSLSRRPDPKYVRHLAMAHFPGTMIGIKFGLPSSELTTATPTRRRRRPHGHKSR